ncbi:MAG: M48 family metalloprotease [Deltaproteobacteria bacterium]|nr:M48 family metalloprotease [Deltaproteobacteria bacterium]MBW2360549.1 M48 family metalloprotease [Deltaproteobacteria bacterium]
MQITFQSARWLLLAGLLALSACTPASRPPPQEKQEPEPEIILQTEAHDEQAGARAAREIAAQVGIVDDSILSSYVAHLGRRLARHAPQTDFAYQFQIVDEDAPNAFALPGGYIYISRGLLLLANSEDELANVLSHEIVHVARRHAAARQSLIRGLPPIFQFFFMGHVASYSRDQEREADSVGQGIAGLAGYDPDGMSRFLRNLEFTERLRLGFSRPQGYFDSHPATAERVATAGARGRSIQWTQQPGVLPNRRAYLRQLDGLVVGIGAAEGVVERSRFLHADLGFSMRFPDGWEVVNTHSAVGAISPQRKAQVVLQLQGAGDDAQQASLEYQDDPELHRLRIASQQPVRLGDLDAYRIEGSAQTAMGAVGVHLTWIARDGSIYRLTGITLGQKSRSGIFANVARSFRPLTSRERRSIRETRLRVVPALASESLGELSSRTRNAWNLQQTAVMNALFADAQLEEGQLVKIAVSQAYSVAPNE